MHSQGEKFQKCKQGEVNFFQQGKHYGEHGHFRDECPSAVFRERGFAMSEEVYEDFSSDHEQVGNGEVKYD